MEPQICSINPAGSLTPDLRPDKGYIPIMWDNVFTRSALIEASTAMESEPNELTGLLIISAASYFNCYKPKTCTSITVRVYAVLWAMQALGSDEEEQATSRSAPSILNHPRSLRFKSFSWLCLTHFGTILGKKNCVTSGVH